MLIKAWQMARLQASVNGIVRDPLTDTPYDVGQDEIHPGILGAKRQPVQLPPGLFK